MPATASPRPFVKMHGLKNHFVIVDARERPYRPGTQEIRRICDPQVGVGADQLVVIEPSDRAGAFMRLYNVDGREVNTCGNATRCVAWLLLEESAADSTTLETGAGVIDCRRAGDMSVRCDLGRVTTDWQEIPLARAVDTDAVDVGGFGPGSAVGLGNPHIVFFVDDLAAVDLEALAPAIQADALFPEQVNVGVAERTGKTSLRLIVYERGAGLTMACGSGASAAAFSAIRRGLLDPGPVAVELPGGVVNVEIVNDRAIMTGPVDFSFRGEL